LQITLEPRAHTNVILTIQAPTDALTGTQFTAVITATGTYGIVRTTTVVDTTRVNVELPIIYLPIISRSFDF
jgi:hypothetical protein